ncbi:MAG: hypothetical protein ILO42_09380 [Clostridia bacterium]|nr:hypothetical protein [Clostridia bacterium]
MSSDKTKKLQITEKSGAKDVICAAVSVFLCLIFVFVFAKYFAADTADVAYPLEGPVSGYNPYVQQYDALKKGQLKLDVEPDPRLAELENPYDPSERTKAKVSYIWDRAYYNGNYYSNFGIAPVLTVYAPYHILTGKLPGTGTVMVIFLLIAAVFMPLTVTAWAEKFSPGIPRPLRALAAVGVFHCSLIALIARGRTPFYYLAAVAANAFISVFFYLCIAAYSSEKKAARYVLYALAGVFYGLAFTSRIPVALIAAFLVIPGLWFFIIRREREGKKLIPIISELASIGIPVVIFFIGSMILNAARFSGPLDFGHSWQLTVTDNRTLELRLSDLPYALYHYFLDMPAKSETYPYVSFSYAKFASYGHYQYRDAGFGLFAIPMTLSLLASPAVIFSRKFTPRRRVFTAAAVAGLVFVALEDFCMGGIIYRYTADLTLVGAIFSVIILFSCCERIRDVFAEKSRIPRYIAYSLTGIIIAVSVYAALRLFLINGNGNVMEYSEEVAKVLPKILPFPGGK